MTSMCYNFFVLQYFSGNSTVIDSLRYENSIAVVFFQSYGISRVYVSLLLEGQGRNKATEYVFIS